MLNNTFSKWALGLMLAFASGSVMAERFCGWYVDELPKKLIISTLEGEWVIKDENHTASNIDKLLEHMRKQGVKQPCVCLEGRTLAPTQNIATVLSIDLLPTNKCIIF